MGGQVAQALVLVAHGKALALEWAGPLAIREYIREDGQDDIAFEGSASFEHVDHASPGDGLWVCELALVDDGPGDWPGSREVLLQARNWRQATADEWKAFRAGESALPSGVQGSG